MKKILTLILTFIVTLSITFVLTGCSIEKILGIISNNIPSDLFNDTTTNNGNNNTSNNNSEEPGVDTKKPREEVINSLGDDYYITVKISGVSEEGEEPGENQELVCTLGRSDNYCLIDYNEASVLYKIIDNKQYLYSKGEGSNNYLSMAVMERESDPFEYVSFIFMPEFENIEYEEKTSIKFLDRNCTKYVSNSAAGLQGIESADASTTLIVDNETGACLKYEISISVSSSGTTITRSSAFECTLFILGDEASELLSDELEKISVDEWNKDSLEELGFASLFVKEASLDGEVPNKPENWSTIYANISPEGLNEMFNAKNIDFEDLLEVFTAFYNAGAAFDYGDEQEIVKVPFDELIDTNFTSLDEVNGNTYISFNSKIPFSSNGEYNNASISAYYTIDGNDVYWEVYINITKNN